MKLPAYYRNLPVAQKLQWASMIVGISAMLAASGSLLIDEQIVGREALRRDLGVLADIFSANSTAALTFNDAEAARELLATLHLNQHITAAFLYSADGKPIAAYRREPGRAQPYRCRRTIEAGSILMVSTCPRTSLAATKNSER